MNTICIFSCWNTHNNRPGLIWIVQSPIMVTIVVRIKRQFLTTFKKRLGKCLKKI